MFLDKLLKKPEPEQEVHHIKDEEPILVDDPNTLIITGDYAHWYMLYGKGYTIYQNTDYVFKELLQKSHSIRASETGNMYIELVLNGDMVYKGTSKADELKDYVSEILDDNRQDVINYGYQENSRLKITKL